MGLVLPVSVSFQFFLCYFVCAPGIYFAGDGFSFKPQWMEGSAQTAFHALFRLLNDFLVAEKPNPFLVLPEENFCFPPSGAEAAMTSFPTVVIVFIIIVVFV